MCCLGQPKAISQVAKAATFLNRAVNKLITVQAAFYLQALCSWESSLKIV